MKKLPNIFKPSIDHYLENNKEVYYSFLDKNEKEERTPRKKEPKKSSNLNVIKQLSNDSLLNKKVLIKTANNEEYKTEILSKMGNNVIISNGKVLSIYEITTIDLI